MDSECLAVLVWRRLNESPSEKEGKYADDHEHTDIPESLNESPSEKEGKCIKSHNLISKHLSLNESPSEKEGKCPH